MKQKFAAIIIHEVCDVLITVVSLCLLAKVISKSGTAIARHLPNTKKRVSILWLCFMLLEMILDWNNY